MQISNDQIVTNALRRFNRKARNFNFRMTKSISKVLKVQKKLINRIKIESFLEYPFPLIYLFCKSRYYAAAVLDLLASGNIFASNATVRIVFDHFVLMFFLATRETEEETKKWSHEFYVKGLRKVILMILEETGVLGKKLDVIEIEKKIRLLDIDRQNQLWDHLLVLKNLELNNLFLTENLRNDLKSQHILNFFVSKNDYWKKMKRSQLEDTRRLCEFNDKFVARDSKKFPFYIDDYFCTLYNLIFRQCSDDIHPTLKGAEDLFSEINKVSFKVTENIKDNAVVLVETLIFQCWLINKALKLNMDIQIDQLMID